ncbi:MAG TPA: PilZ domain-containing protein [Candidatus Angelobacter sp.]|nr:PilZ domain-containing protein [Candidatus Angelobacter sp.]
MSTRSNLRRKVVLALHVVRRSSGVKQLAHTLDVTETSARLGGLNFLLEPGEVIEIRRGAAKARFEVVWVGAPASSLDGQAGVRSLEPFKSIWGVDLPDDQRDFTVNVGMVRNSEPPLHAPSTAPGGKRKHERYACSGSASIKTAGSTFALHGEIKDISEGGVYVELTAPMAVNTEVTLGLKIEGAWIEFAGTVRTSYPLVGMGVAFRQLTPANREKLTALLGKLEQKASAEKSDFVFEFSSSNTAGPKSQSPNGAPAHADAYSLRVLALACQTLANNFDSLQHHYSAAEVEELQMAVALLQKKLLPPRQVELVEFLAALPSGMA